MADLNTSQITDGMSAACFYDDCDWCQSPTCGCPCHTQIEEDWGNEHA